MLFGIEHIAFIITSNALLAHSFSRKDKYCRIWPKVQSNQSSHIIITVYVI